MVYGMSKRRVITPAGLIRAGENSFLFRYLATMNALAGAAGLFERDTAHSGSGFFLNVRLAFTAAAPPSEGEALFDRFLKLFVIDDFSDVLDSKSESALV